MWFPGGTWRMASTRVYTIIVLSGILSQGQSCSPPNPLEGTEVIAEPETTEQVLGYKPAPPLTAADRPSLVTAVRNEGLVTVTWVDNSSNEDNYLVRRYTGATWSDYRMLPADTVQFEDTDVTADGQYCYQVVACQQTSRAASAQVCLSNTAGVKAVDRGLQVPSDFSAATDGQVVVLNWTGDPANGVSVRRYASGIWTKLVDLPPGVTTYTDSTVNTSQTYCYQVAAISETAQSAYSRTACQWIGAKEDEPAAPIPTTPPQAAPGQGTSDLESWTASLRQLPPLPKVHYNWPIETGSLMLPESMPALVEYIRVAHGVGLCGEAVTREQMYFLVNACREVNLRSPAIPATLAVNYSPWHRVFPADAPPTDVGPLHDGEIELFRSRMLQIRGWLAEANSTLGADVRIGALLLDSERFFLRVDSGPGAAEWNNAITGKYDAIYDAAKQVFPAVPVHWYGRGDRPQHFTLQELGDSYGSSMYYLPDLNRVYAIYQRTYERAQSDGVGQLVMWVALAAGYRYDLNGVRTWFMDNDYDIAVSRQLGADLNRVQSSGAPQHWEALDLICFNPAPWYFETPGWAKHFIAYVKGAHGLP